jgi:hypothetical protein
MYVDMPLPQYQRKRSELSTNLPLAAADMACCFKVVDSSV